MAVVDQNAEALRCLLAGPMLAVDVAARVGWEPRTAGQKLAALERQGFVVREIYKSSAGPSSGEKVIYRWRLAPRGEAIASVSLGTDAPTPATVDSAEDLQPTPPAAQPVSAAADRGLALRLEAKEWLLVLAAARQGASSGRADRAQAIRGHLTELEEQANVRWTGQGYVPRQ